MTLATDKTGSLLRRLNEAAQRHAFQPAFVLLIGKRPLKKGWASLRPTVGEAIEHLNKDPLRHAIGIQPASLGSVVLDCDDGDGPQIAKDIVLERYGDVVACTTPSTSGKSNRGHVWLRCDDAEQARNWKFRLEKGHQEIKGEMRSTGGQVRLTAKALPLLIDDLNTAAGKEDEIDL